MPRTVDVEPKLKSLRAFHKREKRMPSYSEMLGLFGYESKNAVFGIIGKLIDLGYVRRVRGKISPTPKFSGTIKLLGLVQAGFPSPAEEELVDLMSLDEFLVRRPDATYMLKVSGDSMIDAGIHPGDMVLVEKGNAPKSGDIVIAQVDGEWTMKYFIKEAGEVRLEPANKKYQAIHPSQSLVIGGLVKTVIRKY